MFYSISVYIIGAAAPAKPPAPHAEPYEAVKSSRAPQNVVVGHGAIHDTMTRRQEAMRIYDAPCYDTWYDTSPLTPFTACSLPFTCITLSKSVTGGGFDCSGGLGLRLPSSSCPLFQ